MNNKKQKKESKAKGEGEKYYQERQKQVLELKQTKDYFPYPHKFETTHTVKNLVEEYDSKITENQQVLEDIVSVGGRVQSMRSAGKFLVFIDLHADEQKIQVMGKKDAFETEDHFQKIKEYIKRGDIVGVKGKIGRSKTGELTIMANLVKLLSPCMHMLPKPTKNTTETLTDQETRYRNRYLDLICNQKPREIFITRSKVISLLRKELTERGFLEVETPILNLLVGGATARPFKTFHNDLDQDMVLRVAPELFLKQCIVGGLNKVFEIGKNFRNEQIDLTHNPEFTACELYWAFADYNDLITMTEELLCKFVLAVKGSYKFKITVDKKEVEIDFTPPWKRVSMMEELERILNKQFPEDLESKETREFFDKVCIDNNVHCSAPRSTARLIDKLVGQFIEPECMNPTFITDHPQIMCPLAKYHRTKKGMTERFELFINQKEFVNAYTELNDPFVQLEEFQKQVEKKKDGDLEANDVDEGFVKCLEHGLPPTAGWGLGVDRFIMLLTDSQNIQEVILFPAMKPLENKMVKEEEKKEEEKKQEEKQEEKKEEKQEENTEQK